MRDLPLKLAALLFAVCGFSASVVAAPKAPLIYGGEEEVRARVVPTGSFADLGADRRENEKLSGIAAKLDGKRIFRWVPSPAGDPMQGADLMDAALSPDGSLFCVAERIGGAGKLNSTRLVLISTRRGLLGARMLDEIRVLRMGFLPGKEGTLWMLAESGRSAGNESGDAPFLLIFDLLNGRETGRSKGLPAVPGAILPDETDLWVASGTGRTLFRYAQDDLASEPERTELPFTASALTLRGKELLVFGEGSGAVYLVRNGQTVQTGTLAVPPGLRPVWCCAMPDQSAGYALVAADGRGGILNGGALSVLRERDTAPGWIFPEGGKLLFGDGKQEALHPFNLPALEPGKEVRPGKERPATRNRTFRMFALRGKVPTLLQLDVRGNVFLVELDRRRVRKTPVLIVDRTGFR